MKELDFDELDKAVNSLMGSVPNDKVQSNATPEPISLPDTPAETPEEPEAPQPTPRPASMQAPTSRPSPQATPKRSGRFMDMVPPSASVKPRDAATAFPNRVGVTIAPRTDASPTSTSSTVKATPSLGAVQPESHQETWPDPLDLTKPTDTSVSSEPTENKDMSSPATETVPAPQTSDPAGASPFLSDAKVEKRPLGSDLAQKLAGASDSLETIEDDAEPVEDFSKEKDQPPAQPLQPELNNDLLSIESSELNEATPNQKLEQPQPPVVSTKPVAPAPLDHRISDHAAAVASATTAPHMTSITQQYKEQASSGDQNHSAIYDTNGYPEPISHPAKKKANWLWIVWVLLLLAIGAGGAVVLYLLHII